MLKVTILGSGGSAGVPMIGGADGSGDWGACDAGEPRNTRTRSSIVIEHAGQRLLVDTSPEMRAQLLACRIPRIDAIFYTHAHADHITGLDDVRILNRIVGRPLDAFASQATLDDLVVRFDYAFRPWKPPYFFGPVMVARPVVPGPVAMMNLSARLFTQAHGRISTFGLRVHRFAYSTDVVGLDEAALAVLAGVDTWVVGAFQRAPHTTHAGLSQVLEWAKRLGVRRTVLTHMGTDMDWAWLAANLPAGVEAAHDGLVLEI